MQVTILKACRDRNIVQFIGACHKDGQLMLVTEFMEGGDLHAALQADASKASGRRLVCGSLPSFV